MVAHLGHQLAILEAKGQLNVELAAAVADRICCSLLDTEHDVADQLLVGAVEAQVVADALAGAQQVCRFGGHMEM